MEALSLHFHCVWMLRYDKNIQPDSFLVNLQCLIVKFKIIIYVTKYLLYLQSELFFTSSNILTHNVPWVLAFQLQLLLACDHYGQ